MTKANRRRASRGEPERYFREVVLPYDGDDCLVWPYSRIDGYGQLGRKLAHRCVCEEINGPPPTPKHEAAHSCGNGGKGCCTKGHLSWKTRAENEADKIVHGTVVLGSMHPNAKLNEDDVRKIRSLMGSLSLRKTAALFLVSPRLVGRIQRGERWRHICD